MINMDTEDFFTKKHNTLWLIARFCAIFAWITMIVSFAMGIFQIQIIISSYSSESIANLYANMSPFQLSFRILFSCGKAFSFFLEGITSWLILTGISKGLYLILETDLNYRDYRDESSNLGGIVTEELPSQEPEFYDTEDVKNIQKWIKKAIPATIFIALVTSSSYYNIASQFVLGIDYSNQSLLIPAIIVGVLSWIIGFGFSAAWYWFKFGALRHGLGMLMEMEMRSRNHSGS